MTFRIVNLTTETLVTAGRTFEPSGSVAGVSTEFLRLSHINGIPTLEHFSSIEGLPEWRADTVYLVSADVRHALRWDRPDVFTPHVETARRDEQGRLVFSRLVGVPHMV